MAAAAQQEMQAAIGGESARVGGAGGAAVSADRAKKCAGTTGVIALIHMGDNWYLCAHEDRNEWTPELKKRWEENFKDGNAPHTVYYWKSGDLNALWHVCGDIYLTRRQVLMCIFMHMSRKGWIPLWAPKTITEDSSWEDIEALGDEFYETLSDMLSSSTEHTPWAITFPAERLEFDEKAALAKGGEEILHGAALRAMKEEACELPVESCDEGKFLLQDKRNSEDPDRYTCVERINVADNNFIYETIVLPEFKKREEESDWHCAHGFHKFFEHFVPGFDEKKFEKEVKAYHETRKPIVLHAEQITSMADKKTRAAVALFKPKTEPARKKQRFE